MADQELPAKPAVGEVGAEVGEAADASIFVGELRKPRDAVLNEYGQSNPAFYEGLLRDDQVYSTFQQRRTAAVAKEWRVEPGGEDPRDVEAADDLRGQLKRIAWDRTTYKMLAGLMYGFGVGECMFGIDGTRVTLDAIKVRRSARFRFDKDSKLRLITQAQPEGILMPEAKFWIFSAGADDDDDPYGCGLGHWLYWPVWFKRNAIKWWSQFLEHFSQPVPWAQFPAGTSDEDRKKLLALLSAVRGGGKIVVPHGIDIQLLQALQDSGGSFDTFSGRMDAAIAKIVLSQTMTTDNGSSRAQATVHEGVAEDIVKSDVDLICESFMQGPARWLTSWNHPGAAVPLVYRDCDEPADLNTTADRDQKLIGVGYRPTPERIKDVYGDGYEPVASPASPAPPAASGAATGGVPGTAAASVNLAEPAPLAPVSAQLDELLGEERWREIIGPEVDALDQLVGDASSLEAIRDRLGELALTEPGKLADGLARMMFAARIAGNVGAEPEEDGGA
jgi:phage gp29-like protein